MAGHITGQVTGWIPLGGLAAVAVLLLLLALVIAAAWAMGRALRRAPRLARGLDDAGKSAAPSEWTAWLPEDRFLELDGRRIRYARAGKGPPLVLIHGIGASLHAWRFVFAPLARARDVIAIDLPGFGLSDAPADGDYGLDAQAGRAAKVLDVLGVRRCALVGSSMGGAIALWMGKLDPERFPKVAALAPAVDPSLVPPGARRLGAASIAWRRALGPRAMRAILARVVAREALIDEASVAAYLKPYLERREPHDAFWAGLGLLADPRLPRALGDSGARVLVLYGLKDRMVPRRSIERYARIASAAELREHPDAGHHLMEDEPRWTVAELEGFFARGEPKL